MDQVFTFNIPTKNIKTTTGTNFAHSCMQGRRPTMEDAYSHHTFLNYQCYAIFDGHGGSAVSQELSNRFFKVFEMYMVVLKKVSKGSNIVFFNVKFPEPVFISNLTESAVFSLKLPFWTSNDFLNFFRPSNTILTWSQTHRARKKTNELEPTWIKLAKPRERITKSIRPCEHHQRNSYLHGQMDRRELRKRCRHRINMRRQYNRHEQQKNVYLQFGRLTSSFNRRRCFQVRHRRPQAELHARTEKNKRNGWQCSE